MKKTQQRLLFFVLVLALVAVPTIAVLAKELGFLTITGPGIKGELILDDHDEMMNLERSGFLDQAGFIKPPENLGQGYNITAHLNLDGQLVPFVEMVYYPNEEGQAGYVHYTGRLNGESLQTVDEWAMLPKETDIALRDLFAAYNVEVQPAVVSVPKAAEPEASKPEAAKPPAAVPVTSSSDSPNPIRLIQPVYIAGIAAILLLIGAGLVLRRRAVHPRSS